MPRLVILQGDAPDSREIGGEVVIGRHPDVDVQVESNMVSRRHARLFPDGDDKWVVEDLGSGNGTFLNGKRVTGPAAVSHSDRLKFGPVQVWRESRSRPLTGSVTHTSKGVTTSFSLTS